MLNRKITAFALGLLVAAGTATLAFAEQTENGDAQEQAALATAKVTMPQAIAIVEKATGGKAADAGLDNENGTINYAVSFTKDNKNQEALVDLVTGKIVTIRDQSAAGEAEVAEDAPEGAGEPAAKPKVN